MNINWYTDTNKGLVIAKCRDGSIYKAQHVILSFPLGVLKATHKSLFTPRLPQGKVQSIESLSFGTVNKIVMRFKEAFWPDE